MIWWRRIGMIDGIDIFRERFAEYTGQYALIGGSACGIVF